MMEKMKQIRATNTQYIFNGESSFLNLFGGKEKLARWLSAQDNILVLPEDITCLDDDGGEEMYRHSQLQATPMDRLMVIQPTWIKYLNHFK